VICKKNRRAFLDHWACSFTIHPHHTFIGVIMHFFDANAHAESKPQRRLRSIHVPRNPSVGIQASNFGRIKPPSRLRRIHVQCRPRNQGFGIQASNFGLIIVIKPPSRLRRIHVHGIQASKSMLPISATSKLHAGFVEFTSTKSKLPISISAAIDMITAPLPSCYIHL